ncbi:MAG TPA: hypothetical protein VEK07_04860 [Polyangiaceae bacterium]|nr:hypothetical protein [Polyangiaceae bacterium]
MSKQQVARSLGVAAVPAPLFEEMVERAKPVTVTQLQSPSPLTTSSELQSQSPRLPASKH